MRINSQWRLTVNLSDAAIGPRSTECYIGDAGKGEDENEAVEAVQ